MNNAVYLINSYLEQENKQVKRAINYELCSELIEWEDSLRYVVSIFTHSISISAYSRHSNYLKASVPILIFRDFLEFLEILEQKPF